MVDMCREKKTSMAEGCRRSDEKRALRGCTECDKFYWEPVEFFQKRCDMITLRFFQDDPSALFWIFCMRAICSSATPAKVALLLGRMTPICILFCTGGNVIAAVIGLSCTLSAA